MAGTASNVIVSPVDVYWRIEHKSVFDLSGLSDPDGTSFKIPDYQGNVAIVAFDLDNSSTLPTPGAGERLIEVDVATGDAASVIAAAAQAAIDADSAFSASVSGSLVTVQGAAVGEAVDPSDTDSGVGIQVCFRGKDFDLGLLQGEPSPENSVDLLPIVAQQTGTTILGQIVRGFEGSVETVLLESTKSKLREFYKIYGETFTPAAGTEVFGFGTGSIGKNMNIDSARLEFIPRNTISDNLSYTQTFRLATPTPGSLVYSGENFRTLTVEWTLIPDLEATRSNLDFAVVGDTSQDGVL